MSNVKEGEKPSPQAVFLLYVHRSRVSRPRSGRPKGVADGNQVNIPDRCQMRSGDLRGGWSSECWTTRYLGRGRLAGKSANGSAPGSEVVLPRSEVIGNLPGKPLA